jgi:hypothetical protein
LIYVVHFERPYKHATHYIGYCADSGHDDRWARHLSGRGARLLKAVHESGIGMEVTAVLPGDRTVERRLHQIQAAAPSKGLRSICPLCRFLIRAKQADSARLQGDYTAIAGSESLTTLVTKGRFSDPKM